MLRPHPGGGGGCGHCCGQMRPRRDVDGGNERDAREREEHGEELCPCELFDAQQDAEEEGKDAAGAGEDRGAGD